MKSIICGACDKEFTPKPNGYNALYCSNTCKTRVRRSRDKEIRPDVVKSRRRNSYVQTKTHDDRYNKHKESVKKSRIPARIWLSEYKTSRGCFDCGYKEHFSALQLDHEGQKTISISQARSSIARLMAEIESGKCVVRCANCHAIKTWERKQK